MARGADARGDRGPDAAPSPEGACDAAQFIALLRSLKIWAGNPSFQELARRSGLARSTLADALSLNRRGLPRLEVVTALLTACGVTGRESASWQRTWRALQDAEDRRPVRHPAEPADGSSGAGSATAPAQLPRFLLDFTGREEELTALRRLFAEAGALTAGGMVVISAMTGAGGVGKTSLALHLAHEVRERYLDGQLFVNLRGTSRTPLRTGEALTQFLISLGVPHEAVPEGDDSKSALFRSMLAPRRMLIVLDDARDAAQVRGLIPGAGPHAVLITSRSRLPTLESTHRVALDVMEQDEARELLGRLVGEERLRDEPEATRDILRSCAGLPLAIRIIAGRLIAAPTMGLRTLSGLLADQNRRLDELEIEDQAVRASFGAGHDLLNAEQAQVFRLLGLWTGPAVGPLAAAALCGRPMRWTQSVLGQLSALHLLGTTQPECYALHDLLRLFAAERAEQDEPSDARAAALHRLLAWYHSAAAAATRALNPEAQLPPVDSFGAAELVPVFDTAEAALLWYEGERANLVAAVRQAAEAELHSLSWRLAKTLWAFFNLRKYWDDWEETARLGLAAARAGADLEGEAVMLNSLGVLAHDLHRFDDMEASCRAALEIQRRRGDRRAIATALGNLSVAYRKLGRLEDAYENQLQTLAFFVELGDTYNEGATRLNLVRILRDLHRPAEALEQCLRSLAVFRDLGNTYAQGAALNTAAATCLQLGEHQQAIDYVTEALSIRSATNDQHGQARSLDTLGQILRELGREEEARAHWTRSLGLFTELNDPYAATLRARLGS
ncbi:XRE family transcriptional regulator [Kitasatospora nipponensis]|uniref:XRE family transcriptional regulator n=1 Tax=Kitasatospora nipponensis TaxID=258049 RepID=A0ABN1W0Z3_9ACTN